MNKTVILDYHVVYDSNDMVDFCKKDNVKYYPFKGDENMSGLISSRNLEKGLIMRTIEDNQIRKWLKLLRVSLELPLKNY